MSSLLLIPLDDTVVFPTMDVTLPVDADGEERVLLVPRHDGEYAAGRHDRRGDRHRPPARRRPRRDALRLDARRRRRRLVGLRRAACASRSPSIPDDVPVDGRTRELEREYRAVVEEILEVRGADARVAEFLRAIREPGALADTIGYAPDVAFEEKVEVLGLLDVTERLAPRGRDPARAPGRAAGPPPHPRRRAVRRREAAARVHPAQADGLHPPRARRRRRLRRRGVPREDRGRRHARRTSASRPTRSSAASSASASRAARPGRSGPTSTGCCRCRGRSAPRSGWTRSSPVRCSTPTTPASRTSRTASSSTSP